MRLTDIKENIRVTERHGSTRRDFLGTTAAAAAGMALGGLSGCRSLPGDPPTGAEPSAPAIAPELADLEPVLRTAVRRLEEKFPYASASAVRNRGWAVQVDDSTREMGERFPSEGVVLRVWNGSHAVEVATGQLTKGAVEKAAGELLSQHQVEGTDAGFDPGDPLQRDFRTSCRVDPIGMDLAEKLDRVVELHARARRHAEGFINTDVDYQENVADELYVNRVRVLSQRVIRVRGDVTFYAPGSRGPVRDSLERGGTAGWEVLEVTDEALMELAEETRRLKAAGPLEPGEYQIVGDGSIAGTLCHESFGHGVELDMFVKDRALAEEFLGKRVGSDLVEIWDDPSLPRAFGSYFFDHEGQLVGPTHIVEKGIFLRGISDLMSASDLGVARSANGRRQDFSRKVYARMSNTFFGRGTSEVADLIAGVDDGIYVRKLTHGMEDPKGWGIFLGAHIGEEIKGGRLTGKLYSPLGMTGYVPDVLGSVDGVGRDFETNPGGCGKGHKEFVAVSTGGPHVRFRARLS